MKKTKAPASASDRFADLKAVVAILNEHGLTEIEIENEHWHCRVRRETVAAPAAVAAAATTTTPAHATTSTPAAPPATAETGDGNVSYITSPFVGTFYRSPNPESAPFVDNGTRIKKGQVICIVEAMKLMNEIESEVDGVVVACLVENGHPVEYGEPLFKIKQG